MVFAWEVSRERSGMCARGYGVKNDNNPLYLSLYTYSINIIHVLYEMGNAIGTSRICRSNDRQLD